MKKKLHSKSIVYDIFDEDDFGDGEDIPAFEKESQGGMDYQLMLERYCQGQLVWRTALGENIRIGNLTDDHLDKLIVFLEKKEPTKIVNHCIVKDWLAIVRTEKLIRNE